MQDNAEAARLQALEEEESENAADEEDEEDEEDGKDKPKIDDEGDKADGDAEGGEMKEENPEPESVKIIVTPEVIVKEMTEKLRGLDELGRQIKEDLSLMQNAYEMLIGFAYKATSLEMADIILTNYYYFFREDRQKDYLLKFYREDSVLNVEGLDGACGAETVVQSILSSIENITMHMQLEPFDIDKDPPARCAAYVKCNYMLKVCFYT